MPEKYIYNTADSCNPKVKFYDCYVDALNSSTDNCTDKCLPYEFTNNENALPFCKEEEFTCGMEKARRVLEKVLKDDYDNDEKSEKCKRNCTILQYSETVAWQGNYTDYIKLSDPRLRAFIFQFPHKKMIVHEEYTITTLTELICYSGGVLGLFIGFSFQVVVHFIIKKMLVWKVCIKE